MSRESNNLSNTTTNKNNLINKLNNNLNQSSINSNLNKESKPQTTKNNNLSKNNVFQSKKRGISIETEKENNIIHCKKLGKNIESVRSKSNLVENPFYAQESSNTNLEKGKTNMRSLKIESRTQNNIQNRHNHREVHGIKFLDKSVSEEIEMYTRKFMEVNAATNKKALELNQKNMEVKNKLLVKFGGDRVLLYVFELAREYSEKMADGYEIRRGQRLFQLKASEEILASRKLANEKLIRQSEFFKSEMRKQKVIQDETNTQIKDSLEKVIFKK